MDRKFTQKIIWFFQRRRGDVRYFSNCLCFKGSYYWLKITRGFEHGTYRRFLYGDAAKEGWRIELIFHPTSFVLGYQYLKDDGYFGLNIQARNHHIVIGPVCLSLQHRKSRWVHSEGYYGGKHV